MLIKAWISNHLDLFYKDEHYPLREKLRKLLFSIIFCLEWNIIAAINDVDIGTLRDLMEFENYTPQTPSKKDLENVVKILNKDINDNDVSFPAKMGSRHSDACMRQIKVRSDERMGFQEVPKHEASLRV